MTNRTDLYVVGTLLVLSLAVGGSGLSFPRLNLLLQLSALAAAAYFMITPRSWRIPRLTSLALGLLGAILVLPLLQLVPLPPSIWTELSGRALPAQLDGLLGTTRWRPLTLDVEGTLRSFVRLFPAAIVFAGCLLLSKSQRVQLLWLVLAVAVVSALLGIVQVVTGGWLTPYVSGHFGYSTGLFVNRNHQAALLLSAMPVAAALAMTQIARGKPQAPWIGASLSAIIIFAIVVLGTTSRMGLLLLPLAVAASLALLSYGRARSGLVLASAAGVAVLAMGLFAQGRIDRTLSRFSGLQDTRFDYWTDIQWALEHYGLAGTGFGTFIPVYKSAESLEAVVPRITNHAHNDYLEILLEGGLPAILLLLLAISLLAVSAYYSLKIKSRRSHALATHAAVIGMSILVVASVVDYPLRMPALGAVFALFCAILLPPAPAAASLAPGKHTNMRRHHIRRVTKVGGLGIVMALLVLATQAGFSAHKLLTGQEAAALSWARWSTEAHERLATDALVRNDLDGALRHGYAAIGLSPISAPAIRSVGLARLARGADQQGTSLMQISVALGWRDPFTQLWAIEAAKQSGESDKALQRAEALFRRNTFVAPAMAQLLASPPTSSTIPQLAQRLASRPHLRGPVFDASGQLPLEAADAWLRLIALLKRTHAPASLREGQPSLTALVSAGRTEQAQRLWELLQDQDQLVSNGNFETVDPRRDGAFPTYWQVPAKNGSVVKVEASEFSPNERALHIRSPRGPVVLRQTLMLRPGTYEFSYRARAVGSTATVRWEIECATSGQRQSVDAVIVPSGKWKEISAAFIVPIRNCPIQRLALRSSGGMSMRDVWIDAIRLRSSRR